VSVHPGVEIIDVTDAPSLALLPPCADPRFDHRSCDYWEEEARGSKAARPSWWQPSARPPAPASGPAASENPFAPPPRPSAFNPFAPTTDALADPWAVLAGEGDEAVGGAGVNPFAPAPRASTVANADWPRKFRLLARGMAVFGSYAKVLLLDGQAAAYAQFGPLSAYPRARQIRDLYPSLPSAPLPAVITCVATTTTARGRGLGRTLVAAVTGDLASRGFAAVEAYPDLTLARDEASAAHPDFWRGCGFAMAVQDERYPVMRLELT
jgi:ribosomal protein S18 acetylase RimI-like enzyme